MSNAGEIFNAVCQAPDTREAIADLSLADAKELYGFLLQTYSENGVSGTILGLMLVEGATRIFGGRKKP